MEGEYHLLPDLTLSGKNWAALVIVGAYRCRPPVHTAVITEADRQLSLVILKLTR